MQPQRVGISVLGVPLDLVVPKEQRHILLDRPRRASTRIQPTRCTASHFGRVPLRLLSDLKRPLLRTEGASGPVPPIRSLIDTALADPFLALPTFRICHGQAPDRG